MKKLILLACVSYMTSSLSAQNVGIGTNSPTASLHVADSSVLFSSSTTGTGNPPASGAGNRMMWYPDKAAFRAGGVAVDFFHFDGNIFWDKANIGNFSFAAGFNTKALGAYSTSMGNGNVVTGQNAAGIGFQNESFGNSSIAIGNNTSANGDFAIAIGASVKANAIHTTALGHQTKANGQGSTAMGSSSTAAGNHSTAMGQTTFAAGDNSTSMGFISSASGTHSTAMGHTTTARAFASTSLGMYNDSIIGSSRTASVPIDPLLYIGNGTIAARSNAVVVYKNANTDINGYTRLGRDTANAYPAIKMKKLIGVSSGTQGTWVNIVHGLNFAKILSVNIILTVPGFVNMPPSYTFSAGYEYHYQVTSQYIVVLNMNANSANILNKNFTILITYEE